MRSLNGSSASCDLDLWPSDPHSWTFHAFALWSTCASWYYYRFFRFQNIMACFCHNICSLPYVKPWWISHVWQRQCSSTQGTRDARVFECEIPALISRDLWLSESSDLSPVEFKIRYIMQQWDYWTSTRCGQLERARCLFLICCLLMLISDISR